MKISYLIPGFKRQVEKVVLMLEQWASRVPLRWRTYHFTKYKMQWNLSFGNVIWNSVFKCTVCYKRLSLVVLCHFSPLEQRFKFIVWLSPTGARQKYLKNKYSIISSLFTLIGVIKLTDIIIAILCKIVN